MAKEVGAGGIFLVAVAPAFSFDEEEDGVDAGEEDEEWALADGGIFLVVVAPAAGEGEDED